jgi:hypothetical protein
MRLGARRAVKEKQQRYTEPLDDVYADGKIDQQDLIFVVTEEKFDPASWEGVTILDAFEDGYYSEWDEDYTGSSEYSYPEFAEAA